MPHRFDQFLEDMEMDTQFTLNAFWVTTDQFLHPLMATEGGHMVGYLVVVWEDVGREDVDDGSHDGEDRVVQCTITVTIADFRARCHIGREVGSVRWVGIRQIGRVKRR